MSESSSEDEEILSEQGSSSPYVYDGVAASDLLFMLMMVLLPQIYNCLQSQKMKKLMNYSKLLFY